MEVKTSEGVIPEHYKICNKPVIWHWKNIKQYKLINI